MTLSTSPIVDRHVVSVKRHRWWFSLTAVMVLASCQQATPTIKPTLTPSPSAAPLAACPSTPAPSGPQVVVKNLPAPDDLAFGLDARLYFSDITAGTISVLNFDGSVERIAAGLNEPEGIVQQGRQYGSGPLLVAEQGRNRVVRIAMDFQSHAVSAWRTFPNASGAAGIDGIGPELSNGDIVIPDSPNGVVWRVSGDGKTATRMASGLVRPVGAAVDRSDRLFIADEGGAVWVLDPTRHRFATLPTPDDVVVGQDGHVYVNTLGDNAIHELDAQGKQVRVISGIHQPQGIALDSADNLYYTEFNAGRIARVVHSFVIDPAKVTRTPQGTYIICPVIHRAPGFTGTLELQVESSTKIQILRLVQPGIDSSGAVEVRSSQPSLALTVVTSGGGTALGLAQSVSLMP